jgi:hypothetical protein
MFRVFFLIFEPGVAWERIAQARRGYVFILVTYLLPIILLATAVEGWGLLRWGKWQEYFQKTRDFSKTTVLHFEILQALMLLAVVFISAALLHAASQNFHGRRTYLQVFTTVAYSFSPMFLLHLLNAEPTMHPFVPWALGITLTVWILYQGVPRVLAPDPAHAFGVYLSAVFILVLASGLTRFLTGMFLLGRFNFSHSWFTRELGQFLGQ